jgi:hypothetical protein
MAPPDTLSRSSFGGAVFFWVGCGWLGGSLAGVGVGGRLAGYWPFLVRRSGRVVTVWPLGRVPGRAALPSRGGIIIVDRYLFVDEVDIHDHADRVQVGQLGMLG